MAIKVKTDDGEIEVTPDQLQFEEGYALITPDNVPKGYFTQEALNQTISERLKRDREKQREQLLQDADFKKSVLSEFNISLDDKGQPKGLKPDFDPEEWKRTKVKELTEPYEVKLKDKDSQLNSMKQGLVRAEIMKTASTLFDEKFVKSFTGEDDPFVVKQFADQFDVDEKGNVLKKDPQGGFAVHNDGSNITPSKFFELNKDKFSGMLRDNRQRGANLNAGGNGSPTKFTEEQIKGMSDAEYEANREAILASAGN